jgi:hypothetical protein
MKKVLKRQEFLNENLNELQIEILDEIKSIEIDCPDCKYIEDDQYTCTTCWCEGGDGGIRIFDWLKEHPKVFL